MTEEQRRQFDMVYEIIEMLSLTPYEINPSETVIFETGVQFNPLAEFEKLKGMMGYYEEIKS